MTADLRTRWPHYFSTYCIHGHHDDCRLTCKVCGEQCLCECHADLSPNDGSGA